MTDSRAVLKRYWGHASTVVLLGGWLLMVPPTTTPGDLPPIQTWDQEGAFDSATLCQAMLHKTGLAAAGGGPASANPMRTGRVSASLISSTASAITTTSSRPSLGMHFRRKRRRVKGLTYGGASGGHDHTSHGSRHIAGATQVLGSRDDASACQVRQFLFSS